MNRDILDIAKRRGFFWPSFEAYGGCSGFYTYGPLGTLLKLRIENLIRDYFVREEDCLLIEVPTLTIEQPWIASGHVKGFSDLIVECKECGEAYRADHLVEEKLNVKTEGLKITELQNLILKNKMKCPKCKGELDKIYDYNLLFKSFIGPGKDKSPGILRPETATTTYLSFKRLFELGRKSIPLGVIQFGKSFRNEISPRKSLVRLREFSQAEAQFFISPKQKNEHPKFDEVKNIEIVALTKQDQEKNKKAKKMRVNDLVRLNLTNAWIAYFLTRSVQLYKKMGIDEKKLICRQHKDEERCFYSKDTWDIEFLSEKFGRIELVGIADRSDYDLKRHMQFSKQDMRVEINGKKLIPHVIEVAYGIDRPLLCVLESCLKKDKDRIYFSFPPEIAPYQVAVFPLVSKNGLPKKAKEVYELLKKEGFYVTYNEQFIGKAYYREDEGGTFCCVTIDYESLKQNDCTIRERDTKRQIRVKINKLPETLRKFLSGEKLKNLGKIIN